MNNSNLPKDTVQFESVGPDHELMKRKQQTLAPIPPTPPEPKVNNIALFGRRYRS
jgi:hypothetical protein